MRRNVIGVILAGFGILLPAYAQTVSVSPATVHLGTFYQFVAKVTGTSPTTVGWTVRLPDGATGSPGTISAGGRYTPPAAIPSTDSVIVTATSTAAPSVSASATVILFNPFPTLASVSPANVAVGPFTLTINGSGFVPGAQVLFGNMGITTSYVSATRLTATGTTSPGASGAQIPGAVVNPDPGSASSSDAVRVLVGPPLTGHKVTFNVAARFLDQAAFGPDAATVARVQSLGLDGYLSEQFSALVSPYPRPGATGFGIEQVQARFFSNAVHGRISFASVLLRPGADLCRFRGGGELVAGT